LGTSGNIFATSDSFLIFCDLHLNSDQFAAAGEEAGADGVMLHLNQDSPHGGRFGGIEIEEESIKQALSVLKIPAGLSIGESRILLEDDWEAIVNLGFSFVNMYAHHLPTFIWEDSRISKVVSIGPGYVFEQIRSLSELEGTSAIVAALAPASGIGMPLTVFDVTTVGLIAKLSSKPVLMPTQRSIRPKDIPFLMKNGCRGLLVSSLVYGEHVEELKEKVSAFRAVTSEGPAPDLQNIP